MIATRIDDGFAIEVTARSGVLVDIQIAETPGTETYELLISTPTGVGVDGLTPNDLLQVGEAIQVLANSANKWPKGRRAA